MRVRDAVVNINIALTWKCGSSNYFVTIPSNKPPKRGPKRRTIKRLSAGEKGIVILLRFVNKWAFIGPT